jgi:hypothetical protein
MFRKAIIKALSVPYKFILFPAPSPLSYIDFPLYFLGLCSKQGKAMNSSQCGVVNKIKGPIFIPLSLHHFGRVAPPLKLSIC